MKKLLLCAGVLAVMASCAKYDVDTPSVEKAGKGIVFEAAVADDATRGGFTPSETGYTPYWYAEQDQIAIWADNAIVGNPGTATGSAVEAFATADVYNYKATKSANKGEFTSVTYNETWNFNYNNNGKGKQVTPKQGQPYYTQESNFFALYPATLAENSTYEEATFTVSLEDVDLADQTQKDAKGAGVYDNNVKWSYSQGEPAEANDAVGEKVNLDFQRELAGIVFSTEGTDQYADYFGTLKSVTLEAKGYTDPDEKTNGENDIDASALTLGEDATLEVAIDDKNAASSELTPGEGESTAKTTLEFTWSDSAKAFMIIAPVSHEDFTEATPETFVATYTFENITFTQTVTSSKAYEKGGFYAFKTLDVTDPDEYPYFVIGTGNTKTLIVNKYGASMFGKGKNDKKDYVVWPVGSKEDDDEADWALTTDFTTIVSVDAWNADLTKVALFTSLNTLELYADTKLPKDMLKDVTGLTTLIAPEVTEIDPAYTNQKYAMVDLELPAYEFTSDVINASFFEKSAASLEILDMSSQKSFEATFAEFKTISFKDFTALTTVTLNEEGTFVKSEAFAGCTSLEEVNGKVDVTGMGVTKVFKGCVALPAVELTSTVIPDETFSGCKALEDVIVNGAQVVPTEIGTEAFYGCSALELMDLAMAKKIGSAAFKNCTSYVGIEDADKDGVWLNVGVETVSYDVFNNTALVNVKFTAATKIQADIFRNNAAKSLKHIQFDNKISLDTNSTLTDKGWDSTFSVFTSNIYLYVNADQAANVKDNTLDMSYTTGSGASAKTVKAAWTFANIATARK